MGAISENKGLGEAALGEFPMARPASHEPSAMTAPDLLLSEIDPELVLLPELYSRPDP